MTIYQHNYRCVYFKIEELIPKALYEKLEKEKRISDGWKFFSEGALMMLDNIRLHFKATVIVNNWWKKGQFQYRGLRTPECKEYSATSQHAFGKAFDFDVSGFTAEQVRQEIIKCKDSKVFANIGGLEVGKINWVHVDARSRFKGKIIAFDTKNKVSYI